MKDQQTISARGFPQHTKLPTPVHSWKRQQPHQPTTTPNPPQHSSNPLMPNSTSLLTLLALPALLLSLLLRLATMPSPSPSPLPGDTLIPAAEMLYTHSIAIHATPHTIFPWILQLGKGRGGWYLPRSWERVLPRATHATRNVNREWTGLKVGGYRS